MRWLRGTFRPLANRNFRLYFTGHGISAIGEWMQKIGQVWLVLELTGSGTLLGVTAGLQHLPTLLIGASAGLLADRVDKRRVLMVTQSCAGVLALLLGIATATGAVTVEMVLVLAFALGVTKALNRPSKHSFVIELVGRDDVTTAITLQSVIQNSAKVVGPALAGILIAAVGMSAAFFVNAASYLAVLVALALMRTADLDTVERVPRAPGQLREGFRYVARTPGLLGPLLMMGVSGLFAYEWHVTIPIFAHEVFDGGAEALGVMFSAMGVGAVTAGLACASRLRPATRTLTTIGLVFGAFLLVVAGAPTLSFALAAMVVLGGSSVLFRAVATAYVQVQSRPEMRGRVMGLLTLAFVGTTPVGGPLVGWIAEMMGVRFTLALGGLATLLAVVAAHWYVRNAAALRSETAAA